MKRSFMRHARILALALLTPLAATAAEWQITDSALAQPPYRGIVPKKADVVFSSRGTNPDAIPVAKSFGATRIEWVYSTDAPFVGQIVREFDWFGGALNSIPKIPNDSAASQDFDGKALVHPRMKSWNRPWITTTNPAAQNALRSMAQSYVTLGARSIQVDDPLLQAYASQWGGDFNPSTVAGFPAFLAKYSDQGAVESASLRGFQGDYREFLRSKFGIKNAEDYKRRQSGLPTTALWNTYLLGTVVDHFDALRGYLDKAHGGRFALSMNLTFLDRPSESNAHFALAAHADYAMSETPIDRPYEIRMRALTARALGLGFVPSIKPKDLAGNRVAIATAYALGGNPIVPWDIYVGNDSAGKPQRWSGTTDDYGDLFRMPKNHPGLFNDREQTAIVGIAVPVDRYDEAATQTLVTKLEQRRIPYAFVALGGKLQKMPAADAERLAKFRLVAVVNRDDDYAAADLAALKQLGARLVRADKLGNQALDEAMPFFTVGATESLRLYPRARLVPGIRDQLVVHLVDEARGARPPESDCKRRIALRRAALGSRNVQNVDWYTPAGKSTLELTRGTNDVLVTVPDCPLWGILAVTLSN